MPAWAPRAQRGGQRAAALLLRLRTGGQGDADRGHGGQTTWTSPLGVSAETPRTHVANGSGAVRGPGEGRSCRQKAGRTGHESQGRGDDGAAGQEGAAHPSAGKPTPAVWYIQWGFPSAGPATADRPAWATSRRLGPSVPYTPAHKASPQPDVAGPPCFWGGKAAGVPAQLPEDGLQDRGDVEGGRPRDGPSEIPFCVFLSGEITGVNDATAACVSTQFLCTRFLFHRNVKCLGSHTPFPSPPQPRFLLLLPESRSVLEEDARGKGNARAHGRPNWGPAPGLGPPRGHEESLHTRTCTGLMSAPSWRAGLSFSGQYPAGTRAGFSQLGTWLFPW